MAKFKAAPVQFAELIEIMQAAHIDPHTASTMRSHRHLPDQCDIRDIGTRSVYGLLGLPVDDVDFDTLLQKLDMAAAKREPFLISTPNVNFLVESHRNAAFRESILSSDLCLVDGMPLIWIAKFLKVPVRERVAGSDLFGRLKARKDTPLRVFLFGGTGDLAEKVGEKLNAEKCGLECVGALNPGFGSVEEFSSSEIIDQINSSGADLLAVFLNAKKAQSWLLLNHDRLTVPIRAQFGATINFEAGTIRRAPPLLRSTGFEWLWRIKEEPYLWRRYWNDGKALLQIVLTCVLPLALAVRRHREARELIVDQSNRTGSMTISFSRAAEGKQCDRILSKIKNAVTEGRSVTIDLSGVDYVDVHFFGMLLAAKKLLAARRLSLNLTGTSHGLRRIFRLNRFEFLLSN